MEYIFPRIAVAVYAGIGTIVLGVLLLLGISWGKKGPLNYIFGSIVCIIVGIFIISIARGGTLKIEGDEVSMKLPIYSQKIFTADQIVDVRTISLDEDSPFKPVRKISGGATRNLKNGWFTLKNGEKAFLLLEGRKAIYVKTKAGDAYLLGIKNFDQLLNVFQKNIKQLNSE
ncbi:MAG TPA: hypothetical protein VGD14_11450 [bacterium]